MAIANYEKSKLQAVLSSAYTIQATSTNESIANFAEKMKIGNKFSVKDGVVVVGKGVSKVKVTYNATSQATASTTRTFTYLSHNGNSISQESHYFASTSNQRSVSFSCILDVAENDTFGLNVYGYVGNKILGGTTLMFTSILIEEI